MNLEEVFESYAEDYLKFDAVENKMSNRPDLHAFMLLDKLVPGEKAMVFDKMYYHTLLSTSENDEIFLNVNIEKLSNITTKEQIQELVRCGVCYDSSCQCLRLYNEFTKRIDKLCQDLDVKDILAKYKHVAAPLGINNRPFRDKKGNIIKKNPQ